MMHPEARLFSGWKPGLLLLAAGLLLQFWSYTTLFLLAALFIGMGALVIFRWAVRS
jgi:hypothetical protein